jgi:hypothetical protein
MYLGSSLESECFNSLIIPWIQVQITLQDSVQVLLLCSQVCDYLVDLSNNRSEERGSAQKQEDAKHLRRHAAAQCGDTFISFGEGDRARSGRQTLSPPELAEMSPAAG